MLYKKNKEEEDEKDDLFESTKNKGKKTFIRKKHNRVLEICPSFNICNCGEVKMSH